MKVFLAIGYKDLSDEIRKGNFQVIDEENNLEALDNLLDFIHADALIINRLLDNDGMQLVHICKKAVKRKMKVLVLIEDFQEYEEKRLVTNLVNEGVTAFLTFQELSTEKIENLLKNYPDEFDFSIFSSVNQKQVEKIEGAGAIISGVRQSSQYIEKVNKGLKRVIAVFSAAPTGKSFITTNLAYTLANKNVQTAVVDADFKNRALSYYFYIDNKKENSGLKELMDLEFLEDVDEYGFDIIEEKLKVYTVHRFDEELYEVPIEINSERFTLLLDYLRTEKDVLLIDMGSSISKITKEILSMADTILFVQNMDYRMMELNKSVLLELCKMNSTLKKKMILVLNQFQVMKDLEEKEIKKYLDIDFVVTVAVPVDPAIVIKNIRYGKPAVAIKECSQEMKEAFENLAYYCYGIGKESKSKRFFNRLFK